MNTMPFSGAAMRQGFAIARELVAEIERQPVNETTLEYDLPAIAGLLERALDVDQDTRRGVLLALADLLTTVRLPVAADWTPCHRDDGTMLLRSVS